MSRRKESDVITKNNSIWDNYIIEGTNPLLFA
jgi:hypothetical protein